MSNLRLWNVYLSKVNNKRYYAVANDMLGVEYRLVCISDSSGDSDLVVSRGQFTSDYVLIGYDDENYVFHPIS